MTIPNFLTILLRPTDWFPVHKSSSRGSNITAEIPEWSLLLKTLLISWYSSLTTVPPWLSSIFQNNNWSAAQLIHVRSTVVYSLPPISPSQPFLSGHVNARKKLRLATGIGFLFYYLLTESQIYLFCVEQVQSLEDPAAHPIVKSVEYPRCDSDMGIPAFWASPFPKPYRYRHPLLILP